MARPPLLHVCCLVVCTGAFACGNTADTADVAAADALDRGPCTVEIAPHPLLDAPHILAADYDEAGYNSNPPSSGPHCVAWGDWRVYDRPLPRCNWIHNLEHGGVVLTWSCPNGCPAIAAALADVARTAVDSCAPPRVLVTPDPAAPTKVAAAAWGWTFRASCFDEAARAALAGFVNEHVGAGAELMICSGGGATP